MRRHLVIAVVLALLATLAPRGSAWAQASETALAEQLFLDGQRLMTEGKLDEACPKLAESHRLDPKLGTLLNLATCHEQQGSFAAAWGEFTDALALAERARRGDRIDFARSHIAEIERRIAHVRLNAVPPVPKDLEIRLDGKTIRATFGTALPLDPGPHTVEGTAPGKKTWTTTFEARSGAESTVELPPLRDEDDARPRPDVAPTPAPVQRGSRSPRRTIGWIMAGAGAAGLAAGSVFGVLALSKEHSASGVCPAAECATPEGVHAHDVARTHATISTVAFAAGAVLGAAGVALVLTAPNDVAQARLDVGPGGFALAGAW